MSRPTRQPTGVEEQAVFCLPAGFLCAWLFALSWQVFGYRGLQLHLYLHTTHLSCYTTRTVPFLGLDGLTDNLLESSQGTPEKEEGWRRLKGTG